MSRGPYETDKDLQGKSKSANRAAGKFVSDYDIVGRSDRPNQMGRERQRDQKEPKFVSDDDIVQRRVA